MLLIQVIYYIQISYTCIVFISVIIYLSSNTGLDIFSIRYYWLQYNSRNREHIRHKANILLFLVLQTFSKILRAGGGKKIKNKIVNFQHIFIFE